MIAARRGAFAAGSRRVGDAVMRSAVLIVDMLNHYDHEDAGDLMPSVREALPAICELVARARAADVPVVYVNDNHGDWSACRPELVERALRGRAPELVEPIAPPPDVGFVVKARHSIFYETQLEYLLRQEEVERIVLAGQVTEQCILYSALDAYVRHFAVAVPRDAVAHIHEDLAGAALRMMERNMSADVAAAADCAL
jgi:nicotinamidase-related amidase